MIVSNFHSKLSDLLDELEDAAMEQKRLYGKSNKSTNK